MRREHARLLGAASCPVSKPECALGRSPFLRLKSLLLAKVAELSVQRPSNPAGRAAPALG